MVAFAKAIPLYLVATIFRVKASLKDTFASERRTQNTPAQLTWPNSLSRDLRAPVGSE